MINRKWNRAAAILALVAATILGIGLLNKESVIDPQLQAEIEAKISECRERDKIASSMQDTGEEGVYFAEDLDRYNKIAKECFDRVSEYLRSND